MIARPMTKVKQSRNARGFTLIELMITVAVLIILAMAGLPMYRSFITTQRIKTASFDMMALIIYTRSEAIKRNTSVTLNSDGTTFTNGSNFQVTTIPPGATATTTIKQQAMFTGIQIDCVNTTVNPHVYLTSCPAGGIAYNGSGRLANAFAPMEIHEPNAAADVAASYRCISIDLSGRPNSKKGQC